MAKAEITVTVRSRDGDPKWVDFSKKLRDLLNRESMDTVCDTADYVLAEFLADALYGLKVAIDRRNRQGEDVVTSTVPVDLTG